MPFSNETTVFGKLIACCFFYEILFFISMSILLTDLSETCKKCPSLLRHVDRQNTEDYDKSSLCKAKQQVASSINNL